MNFNTVYLNFVRGPWGKIQVVPFPFSFKQQESNLVLWSFLIASHPHLQALPLNGTAGILPLTDKLPHGLLKAPFLQASHIPKSLPRVIQLMYPYSFVASER